VEQIEPNPSD
jgi:hypothetical protein